MILLLLSLRFLPCILFNILRLEKCFDLLYYATMALILPLFVGLFIIYPITTTVEGRRESASDSIPW